MSIYTDDIRQGIAEPRFGYTEDQVAYLTKMARRIDQEILALREENKRLREQSGSGSTS